MSVTRRRVLKMLPIAAVGLLAGRRYIPGLLAHAPSEATTPAPCNSYGGVTLTGWSTVLGDAHFTCPGETAVGQGDIATLHTPSYSELRANIHHRKIMAHNITFYRVADRVVEETAWDVTHMCGYKFRLPYTPQRVDNASLNGQTVEGGLFIWDGAGTRLDYGMAFQWVINPWAPDFGYLNAWSGTKWVAVGYLDPTKEAGKWHDVRMVFNYRDRTTALSIGGEPYPSLFAIEPKNWTETQTAARLQAEVISIYPNCGQSSIPSHQAQFKDWYWGWACKRVFLPFARTDLSPSFCGSPYFTYPTANQAVLQSFDACWISGCKMVLQAYQNGQLIYEKKDATSCTSLTVPIGRTQLKLWGPGAPTPAHEIWINVVAATPTATSTATSTTTPTATSTATSTTTPTTSCNSARFTAPGGNQTVARPFNVCWTPGGCRMVLQAYQNGQLIYENRDAASCTSITQTDIPPGQTELKIWAPGASTPSDQVWINAL